MAQLGAAGRRISVLEEGRGPPVILVHSAGNPGQQWRMIAAGLAQAGFRALAPDLSGYGETGAAAAGQGALEADDEVLDAVLTHAAEPAHLVGHSYGGVVAARLALRRPEQVRTLCLYEPAAFYALEALAPDSHRGVAAFIRRYAALVDGGELERAAQLALEFSTGPRAWELLPAAHRQRAMELAPLVRRNFDAVLDGGITREELGRLSPRALVLAGDQSPELLRDTALAAARAIPAARCAVLPRAGHMGPVTAAKRVLEALRGHFAPQGA